MERSGQAPSVSIPMGSRVSGTTLEVVEPVFTPPASGTHVLISVEDFNEYLALKKQTEVFPCSLAPFALIPVVFSANI
jgi:hypothetical protein